MTCRRVDFSHLALSRVITSSFPSRKIYSRFLDPQDELLPLGGSYFLMMVSRQLVLAQHFWSRLRSRSSFGRSLAKQSSRCRSPHLLDGNICSITKASRLLLLERALPAALLLSVLSYYIFLLSMYNQAGTYFRLRGVIDGA